MQVSRNKLRDEVRTSGLSLHATSGCSEHVRVGTGGAFNPRLPWGCGWVAGAPEGVGQQRPNRGFTVRRSARQSYLHVRHEPGDRLPIGADPSIRASHSSRADAPCVKECGTHAEPALRLIA